MVTLQAKRVASSCGRPLVPVVSTKAVQHELDHVALAMVRRGGMGKDQQLHVSRVRFQADKPLAQILAPPAAKQKPFSSKTQVCSCYYSEWLATLGSVMRFRHVFHPVNVREEREFERANVAAKTSRYLATNPMNRYASDVAYREKVDRIAAGLEGIKDLVLDIGGNTAGEATILSQKGFSFVVGDINEVALDLSRQRVEKFGLRQPRYIALDVHALPFKDASLSAVTVIEAMHHFPDYDQALSEIFRVLRPGGRLFSLEPNALSPLRRVSEVRDRLRGTVEKSFYIGQLRRLCSCAGFENIQIDALATGRSSWKKDEIPPYRRPLWRLHGWLALRYPTFFGSLRLHASKPGTLVEPLELSKLESLLQSPRTGGPLRLDRARRLWVEADGSAAFPELNGIALLVQDDAVGV